jgi:hypothetical protein
LDRTQPGLPMMKGRGTTMTHDYKRNGTTTLFAALNTANGEVYGLCQSGQQKASDILEKVTRAQAAINNRRSA